eukprot:TRINITY_DN2537_c1_g1_i1.p1 TRINITY_DN2537_c1_g1~~TRINITY_DN2537_c1_g1_i1.p1  ORF type:complete len:242 (-),score=27.82 TRINITY_DN2537_c1_g1_i1:42-767(-)
MLLSPEMMVDSGPPPQEVLDKMWLWKLLIAGFSVLFIFQVLAFDIAGALLTALLLGFGWIMLKDGMEDMSKYALIYSVLCGLNFVFSIMPLVGELSGRITRRTVVHSPVHVVNGTTELTVVVATEKSSFFNPDLGLAYNCESLSMILAPICMCLGCFLAASAHSEIQRLIPPALADEEWDVRQFTNMQTITENSRQSTTIRNAIRAATSDFTRTRGSEGETRSTARDTLVHFEGTGHKLDN